MSRVLFLVHVAWMKRCIKLINSTLKVLLVNLRNVNNFFSMKIYKMTQLPIMQFSIQNKI